METRYPIAEIFSSIQGEGTWVGQRQLFVRFAGCTVGKPWSNDSSSSSFSIIHSPNHERCVAWDGTEFVCDTDYRKTERLTAEEILRRADGEQHICITGGEPLMHNLAPFIKACAGKNLRLHFETSGTVDIYDTMGLCIGSCVPRWITVSPKQKFFPQSLRLADEIKVLVQRSTFNREAFVQTFGSYLDKVFLQPINFEDKLNTDNIAFCIELMQRYPTVRLSTQMHKVWGVR